MKKLYLLGATGSIGKQVLEVLDEEYKIVSLSVGQNITALAEIIDKYKPEFVCVQLREDYEKLSLKYPYIHFSWGEEGLIEAAMYGEDGGYFINALVGMVGLMPTIKAITKKRTILLANKETLVVGGKFVTALAKKNKVPIIPIDSEHSAIFQCLNSRPLDEVKQVIITASGGSFRDLTREQLANVSLASALNHPNWQMGKKITIDSATMVNKGLEVIEAHYLFDLPYDKITTIIHPESIIHSMVEFIDSSIIAQLSFPDMRIPIKYALSYPQKKYYQTEVALDFKKIKSLTFKEMSFTRYPLLALAYEVGKEGGILPAVYNASNEAAVALFLENKITFLDIEKIIFDAVNKAKIIKNPQLEDLIAISQAIKKQILAQYLS